MGIFPTPAKDAMVPDLARPSLRYPPIDSWSPADWERELSSAALDDPFNEDELIGLPEPVQRYFRAAITVGTPMATTVRLRMRGTLKIGRWLPFRARQVLNPHVGFIWSARAGGLIAGYDRYLAGAGEMSWKAIGLFRVAHGEGPDISASAAGRGGAEAMWVPTALLPRFGVTWSADDDEHITAHFHLGATPIDLRIAVDPSGSARSVSFDRWGDPDNTGTWQWHTFGGHVTGRRTFGGLTIPSTGQFGWHFGTDRWPTGEFFRYDITSLAVIPMDPATRPAR